MKRVHGYIKGVKFLNSCATLSFLRPKMSRGNWNTTLKVDRCLIKVSQSSCLYRALSVSKHFFIIPNYANNCKITWMLKTIKIPIIALTCFSSRRNVINVINDEHNRITIVVLAKHEIAPWWWFLREPKHVGAIIGILIVFNIPVIL
jgi:hypothetical protein